MIPHLFGDRSHACSRQPKSLCLSQRVTPKTSTSTSGVEAISNDLPLLLIDDLFIEQVFVNLLENAARYTPPGTQVAVQAAIDGRFVRITPSADGGRGSGLGLAICRAIAKVHGGNIAASNRPGGGAEFILRLLVRKDAPQVSLATLIF